MNPIDRVRGAIEARTGPTKPTRRGFMARCPAHEDRNPSLSVDVADDGRVLVNCRAGCRTDVVLERSGLKFADLEPPHLSADGPAHRGAPRRRPSAASLRPSERSFDSLDAAAQAIASGLGGEQTVHPYELYADQLSFAVVRVDLPDGSKRIRPVQPGQDGRWRYGLPEVGRPLFRSWMIREGDEPVLVVEGEKCAQAAVDVGLNATTSVGGSSAASKSDWSVLAGLQVVLVPDNDDAGRAYVSDVGRLLDRLVPPAIVRLLELPDLGEGEDIADFIERRRGEVCDPVDVRHEIEALAQDAPLRQPPESITDIERVDVELTQGERHVALDRVEEVLRALRQPLLYQRSGQLVYPRVPVRSGSGGTDGPETVGIKTANASSVAESLNRVARFHRINDKGEAKPRDCPREVAEWYASRPSWRLPALQQVSGGPVMVADGRIVDRPGFDHQSGVYVFLDGLKWPGVPRSPAQADAQRALGILKVPFAGFPFEDEADRAIALAAVCTGVARLACGKAPAFAFTAPSAATGKGLACNVIANIVSGHDAPAMSMGGSEEETEKRIFALLLEGAPVVMFDNLERELGGESICSAITEAVFASRHLGYSRTGRVSTLSTLWLANGNNLVVSGDARTRVVTARLDAGCERPWTRKFDGDLLQDVRKRRGEFLSAALTILVAYRAAGSPDQGLEPCRFVKWSYLVRSALVWAGAADPMAGMGRVEAQDPETLDLRALMHAWKRQIGPRAVTASNAIESAKGHGDFEAALRAIASGADGACARRLGKYLSKREKRLVDGLRFEKAGMHAGTARWKLVERADPSGIGGDREGSESEARCEPHHPSGDVGTQVGVARDDDGRAGGFGGFPSLPLEREEGEEGCSRGQGETKPPSPPSPPTEKVTDSEVPR